jgi:methionine aminotransferase
VPSFSSAITSKLPAVGTTIFTVMSKLAQEHNAINLSQGFPDFDCAPRLLELVAKYFNAGLNQYPPTYGIFTAITAFVRPGDEVVLFEPTYDSYAPAVEVNGGRPVYVRLQYPDYSIDWNAVQQAITPKTRMIVINTPNNPTTSVFSAEDMRAFENILRNTNIIVVADEVYEHLIYDGHQHQSVARFPGLAERSFVVSSFGKTYSVTGWKMGYVLAPRELMNEFRKVHQFNVFVTNGPLQYVLADYMADASAYLSLAAFYQKKRDFFLAGLAGSRFRVLPSRGTFFQNLAYDAISDEKDTDLAVRLTKEKGLASIPLSVFYHDGHCDKVLRFCFAKSEQTLAKGAAILRSL